MNEIIATIWAGVPCAALVLVVVCAVVAYACAFAYAWDKKRYGVMAILIVIGLIGLLYVCGLGSWKQ